MSSSPTDPYQPASAQPAPERPARSPVEANGTGASPEVPGGTSTMKPHGDGGASQVAPAAPATNTPTRHEAKATTETKKPWNWRVVLIDDPDHTYDYVVRMTMQLFGFDQQRALAVATTVDTEGRAVLTTAHRELAELKREQVMEFGRDPMSRTSKGGMTAVLEPAE